MNRRYYFRIFFLALAYFILIVEFTYTQAKEKEKLIISMPDNLNISTERILYTAAKRMGYEVDFEASPIGSALANTNSGYTDMLALQVKGVEKEYPDLVRIPYSFDVIRVVVFADEMSNLKVSNWSDLKGLRIGYRKENFYIHDKILDLVGDKCVAYSNDKLYDALINHEIDVILKHYNGESEIASPKNIKQVGIVKTSKAYSYMNKNHEKLVPEFVKTFSEMEEDGTIKRIMMGKFPSKKKKVVHISSYNSEMKRESQIQEGVKKSLSTIDNLEYYNFNLYANRNQSGYEQNIIMANNIRETFLESNPSVIIVSDNVALEFVANYYSTLFEGIPVVFCGITELNTALLSDFQENTTGCTELVSATSTVQKMLTLYPNTKNIFVLNDYSETGRIVANTVKNQLSVMNLEVKIEYNENTTFEELKDKIKKFGKDTKILLGSYYGDGTNFYEEEAFQKQLASISSGPIFTLLSSYTGSGTLGGLVSSSYKQGETAGTFARDILKGKAVAKIPVLYSSESLNEWIFDINVINKYKINMKLLPEDSKLLNKKLSFIEANTKEVIVISFVLGILMLIIVMISLLLASLKKKNNILKKEQKKQLEENEKLIKNNYASKLISGICNVMKHTPIAFVITCEDTVTKVNEYARFELGIEQGKNFREYFKNPEIYDKIFRMLNSYQVTNSHTALFQMADGDTNRHNMSSVVLSVNNKKQCVYFGVNMEEIEHLKEHMSRSKSDLQKIIDAYPTAMVIINIEDNSLEYANENFLKIFDYQDIEQTDSNEIYALVKRVFAGWQGETVVFDFHRINKCNEEIDVKFYANQIIYSDKNCIILIGQDVTSETLREKMLLNATEKEREANLLKNVFLANMSHEIRTPMNAIIGLSRLAMMKRQTAENTEFFNKINSSANNLLSIINDILDFSKIEAEKLDILEEEFQLEETISNVFLVAVEHTEDKKVEILLDIEPGVPCYLRGDKTRLWQVLKNLLDNAVKYTMAGYVLLIIRVEDMSSDNVTLRFTVKDTGIGMTKEQLEHLYTPFKQFSRNNVKKAGTGLGMSITKQLVNLMGGTIQVESVFGKGTEFGVLISFKRSENDKCISDIVNETIKKSNEKIEKVLLVDDDERSLSIMSSILKMANVESVCVTNEEEALKAAAEYKRFKIIIIDHMLGEENGIELGRKLKESMLKKAKMLLVTAYSPKIISNDILKKAGFTDVIEKPFIISSFMQKIYSVMPTVSKQEFIPKANYNNASVLLCEDNEINQIVAIGLLKSYGINPDVAEDGLIALDMIHKKKYDLIFMDIIMPKMDGHETTKRIRSEESQNQNVPIVAMTANVMKDEVNQCLEEGMNEHIEKPIDIQKFESALAKFLG